MSLFQNESVPNEVLDHFDAAVFELTQLGYWFIEGQTLIEDLICEQI